MPPLASSKVQDKVTSFLGSVLEVSDEETVPLKNGRLTLLELEQFKVERKLSKQIVILSVVSVILNFLMAAAAFVIAAMRDSAATYAFAADCLLDMLSSSILLWRYYGNETIESQNKERNACVCLGSLFVVSAVAVIAKSAVDISQRDHPVTFRALSVLSVLGTGVCVAMAITKYIFSRKAKSASLFLDALNSIISGMLALVITLSDVFYQMNNDVWFLDPLLSIILSVILIFYGLKVIFDHRSPLSHNC